jgi:hypothetical protein
LLLGVHPILRRDFRVFRLTFISLSPPDSAFNALLTLEGLRGYSGIGGQVHT